jgi:hypothetical protein
MDLCKYKDILGKPREGMHSIRLFDISVVDIILTLFLGLFLAKIFKLTKFNGILLAFILSIVFHKLFCVETTFMKAIKDFLSR